VTPRHLHEAEDDGFAVPRLPVRCSCEGHERVRVAGRIQLVQPEGVPSGGKA
jgi:hypothetical protein